MKRTKQLIVFIMSVMLITSSCGKEEDPPAPVVTPTTTSPPVSTVGSYTVNGTTYSLTASSNMYFTDNQDKSYYSGNQTPVNNSVFQMIYVDQDYINTTVADGSTVSFTFDSNLGALPSPTYDKCSLEIPENVMLSNEVTWQSQSTGTMSISRNGNVYTFTCSNIPMVDNANSANTTTASVNYKLTIN